MGSNVINSPGCFGSANSNLFLPLSGPNKDSQTGFSVVGNQLLPFPQAGSTPPANFNSTPYETLSREDLRSNAGLPAECPPESAVHVCEPG